jgi:hypothetical protein
VTGAEDSAKTNRQRFAKAAAARGLKVSSGLVTAAAAAAVVVVVAALMLPYWRLSKVVKAKG